MSSLNLRPAIPLFVLVGLAAAGIAWMLGSHPLADLILLATLIIGALPLVWEIIQSILQRHFGIDLIAIVAIVASLFLHQYLAGTVILLMLSGGEALEGYALRRARKELTELINRAPTQAHKKDGGSIIDVPVDSIVPGDIVIVKPGETIPMDGEVTDGIGMVDESALTGEAMPVETARGKKVMSGSVSKDNVLEIRATRPSSESKYAQIIRLVRDAENQKAPFVRLADRYSVWFTALTFILAVLAWFLSGDPVRVLAVLVVATPCPLILATPIAFASGISRAAKRGIIVKNGGALEQLGEAKSFAFDKTGTITLGVPKIVHIEGYALPSEKILHIAASLDQLSTHILARSLVQTAREKGVTLAYPEQFQEHLGEGVSGIINGQTYYLARLRYLSSVHIAVPSAVEKEHEKSRAEGQITVYLASENEVLGAIEFADTVRDNVRTLFANLRTLGIRKVVMLTGDKKPVALKIATEIGIPLEDVRAECLPGDKVKEVVALHSDFPPVVMVGDGVNDAPAITAADVGIAMGGHGSTASSEAGDIVILVDKIERVGEALAIGHRVMEIAKQSIFVGIGLSILLMIVAALGFIMPVYGALLQEIVDVVVILNALRVLLINTKPEKA